MTAHALTRASAAEYLDAHQLGHSNTIMVQKVYGRFDVTLRDLQGVEHSRDTIRDTPTNQRGGNA